MAIVHVTDASFAKDVLSSEQPVLVDFWADWCGPCKMIAPLIEEIAAEYAGKLKVGKVNVDESSQVAGKYGIMSIPTLMFFRQGKVMGQVVGALSRGDLKRKIDELL